MLDTFWVVCGKQYWVRCLMRAGRVMWRKGCSGVVNCSGCRSEEAKACPFTANQDAVGCGGEGSVYRAMEVGWST